MQSVLKSWQQIIGVLIGAVLALIGSAWASGNRAGTTQSQLDELRSDRIPRIERRIDILEQNVLSQLREHSQKLEDIRVLVERIRTEQQLKK